MLPALCWGAGVAEALRYLGGEVASWPRENRCYSCHNNGDAARTLLRAHRMGLPVDQQNLRGTLDWLANPERWDNQPGDPAFGDRKLARIQFAAALLEAIEAGAIPDRGALEKAAALVAAMQEQEGGFTVDPESSSGSPVTYGPMLATHMARRVLLAGGKKQEASRAEQWLRNRRAASLVDAAAKLMATGDPGAAEFVLSRQAPNGSWLSEAFDTALALLALEQNKEPRAQEAIARGRRYLLDSQLPEGGWRGTTRPAGAASYAQHVSTSGWAALALLATAP